MRKNIMDYGILTPLVENKDIEEIRVGSSGKVFASRLNILGDSGIQFENKDQLEELIQNILQHSEEAQEWIDGRTISVTVEMETLEKIRLTRTARLSRKGEADGIEYETYIIIRKPSTANRQ